ncbi:uncharacterized protein [Ptychodera flava]|uniref:uncharacterized protein n=1 Tax=Ptychodera flava TaxID=63121 RepID=UPI00396A35BB
MGYCAKKPPKVNSYGCIWYCVFAVVAFVYLLVDAVRRYNYYNNEITWSDGEKPNTELAVYIFLMVAATLSMVAFIPTQLLQTGNPPNDGVQLGKKKHEKKFDMGYDSRKGPGNAERLLHHVGPIGATLHMISAFCLLLPILLLQAAEVKEEYLPKKAIWWTELDFLFGSAIKSVTPSVHPTETTSTTPMPAITAAVTYQFYASPSISIAFLNYLVPLFLYAVQFADSFWLTHRVFSIFFGLELVLITINQAFTYCGFSILYKLGMAGWETPELVDEPMLIGIGLTVFLYIASSFIALLFSLVVYLYGHGQLQRSYKKLQDKEHPADVQTTDSVAFKCKGFFPHICALIVFGLFLGFRVPLLVEYYKVCMIAGDSISLACLVLDIIFIIQWIALWLVFTVKHEWKFTTSYIYDRPVMPNSQYSTMTMSKKHIGSQQSLSKLVGDGIEMTVVNSGTRHNVKNLAKQEAIMRAMKQPALPSPENGTVERMYRNPLNKSQDSLNSERGVSQKHPSQSPAPVRQTNQYSNNTKVTTP